MSAKVYTPLIAGNGGVVTEQLDSLPVSGVSAMGVSSIGKQVLFDALTSDETTTAIAAAIAVVNANFIAKNDYNATGGIQYSKASGYASLNFGSIDTTVDSFPTLLFAASAEEGFYVTHGGANLSVSAANISLTATSYSVSNNTVFRNAIGLGLNSNVKFQSVLLGFNLPSPRMYTENADTGPLLLTSGQGVGVLGALSVSGGLTLESLPTTDPAISSQVWRNGGLLATGNFVAATARTALGLGNVENVAASATYVALTGAQTIAGEKTFTGKIQNTGTSSSDSLLRMGSIEVQPFAVNNCWIGENVRFTGGTFKRRAAGGATLMYFLSGEYHIRVDATGAAEASTTGNTQVKVAATGSVGIGGSIASSGGSFVGAGLVVSASTAVFAGTVTADAGGVFIGGGAVRASSASINLGASYGTTNDNFANLFLRASAAITLGGDVAMSRDGVGILVQRSGSVAQTHRIHKTYSSATSFECLEFDTATDAGSLRIGQRVGSAGGAFRVLDIGRYASDGTWASGIRVETNGTVTVGSSMNQTTIPVIRTNQILRNAGGVPIDLYNGDFTADNSAKITIGPNGSLTNTSGSCGEMRFNSTLNQTGTAGSVNFFINRIETAIGSGEHNFVQFNRGATKCFTVNRLGGVFATGLILDGLPTSDPAVAGQVWRSGNDLKISTG